MSSRLKTEINFFESKRMELLDRAPGQYALIKNAKVIGIFESEIDALSEGWSKFGNTAFLVKKITEHEEPLLFTSQFLV